MLILISCCDFFVANYCIKYTILHGKTVLILFGFEFGVLFVSAVSYVIRYLLHLIDGRFENGLQSKGLYIMLLELMCDGLKFVTYIIFFCLVFVYYGLPVHIVRYTCNLIKKTLLSLLLL